MIYFGIKYHRDNVNREFIELVCAILEEAKMQPFCVVRDIEQWGSYDFSAEDLMEKTFQMIDLSKGVVIDLSEKGVGVGIEAGYAYAKGIPILVMARMGSDVSATISAIASAILIYKDDESLKTELPPMLKGMMKI